MITAISLKELNERVRKGIESFLPDIYWIVAETLDVRINSNGHCYLEFVEKEEKSNRIVAKASGIIFAPQFKMLKIYFEESTKQSFTSGLKVLVNVSANFHVMYGFSLVVNDIDPSYTIGAINLKRKEIIHQLQEDGIFDLNKDLIIPKLPQRIAIISSPTAAGYEDFCTHLREDGSHYNYTVVLFPAIMQGDQCEASIIDALNQIYEQIEMFDVVVIIRGGGSSSDLNCFDSYALCANCAQFPLPIISGIGHERDESIVDLVAHTRAKTPTAAAEIILTLFREADKEIQHQRETLIYYTQQLLNIQKERILNDSKQIPLWGRYAIQSQQHALEKTNSLLTHTVCSFLTNQNHQIDLLEQKIKMLSPEQILKRGYSLTLYNGKIVKDASLVPSGVEIKTRVNKGEIKSIVK